MDKAIVKAALAAVRKEMRARMGKKIAPKQPDEESAEEEAMESPEVEAAEEEKPKKASGLAQAIGSALKKG